MSTKCVEKFWKRWASDMIYAIHVRDDVNGWEEVESYSSYNEIPDDDKGQFDWLLTKGFGNMTQGDTIWEIRQS